MDSCYVGKPHQESFLTKQPHIFHNIFICKNKFLYFEPCIECSRSISIILRNSFFFRHSILNFFNFSSIPFNLSTSYEQYSWAIRCHYFFYYLFRYLGSHFPISNIPALTDYFFVSCNRAAFRGKMFTKT